MLPFRAALLFCFHSNAAMRSSAFPLPLRIVRIVRELYVVETEWEENSSHWAACDVCRERARRQPSAFPGDIPTSFGTDSHGMANDSLDCHNHRYHDHENHQQGSNYGTQEQGGKHKSDHC